MRGRESMKGECEGKEGKGRRTIEQEGVRGSREQRRERGRSKPKGRKGGGGQGRDSIS